MQYSSELGRPSNKGIILGTNNICIVLNGGKWRIKIIIIDVLVFGVVHIGG